MTTIQDIETAVARINQTAKFTAQDAQSLGIRLSALGPGPDSVDVVALSQECQRVELYGADGRVTGTWESPEVSYVVAVSGIALREEPYFGNPALNFSDLQLLAGYSVLPDGTAVCVNVSSSTAIPRLDPPLVARIF